MSSPRSNGIARVCGQLRFDAEDTERGIDARQGSRYAGRQPTQTDGSEDSRAALDAQLEELIGDLVADGSLSGDNVEVVGGRDEHEALFVGNLVGLGDTLHVVRADEHDLAAVGAHARDLHVGRVVGHHYDGAHVQESCRAGDRLRVVAARMDDNTAGAFIGRKLRQCVVARRGS